MKRSFRPPRGTACPCCSRGGAASVTDAYAPTGALSNERPPFMILVLDFGSQYTQLIARRVREERVTCEIHPYSLSLDEIRRRNPSGVILSGGPSSVYATTGPRPDPGVLALGVP